MSVDSLSATFAALADPTRRAILARLSEGPATVKELTAPFAMSGPAVSKHLRVLERAGLITRGREGNGVLAGSRRRLSRRSPNGPRTTAVSGTRASNDWTPTSNA